MHEHHWQSRQLPYDEGGDLLQTRCQDCGLTYTVELPINDSACRGYDLEPSGALIEGEGAL